MSICNKIRLQILTGQSKINAIEMKNIEGIGRGEHAIPIRNLKKHKDPKDKAEKKFNFLESTFNFRYLLLHGFCFLNILD